MIRVPHLTSAELGKLVGDQLGTELWLKRMFNEIRRYPNEIPCDAGEIPSMCIPRASGDEKVEWGFTAGFSCLVPGDDGSIAVRRAGHFPGCACLALLSLLQEAGAANGKTLTVDLSIPEGDETQEFRALLARVTAALKNVTINQRPGRPDQPVTETPRTVMLPTNSVAVVQQLQQIDVGRFVALVTCINGSLSVGDDLKIADGNSFKSLQSHCPLLQIGDATGMKKADSSDAFDGPFTMMFAMWFPPGTAFSSMGIVKEAAPPAFTPEKLPSRPSLAQGGKKGGKGFFKKLFG